MNLKAIFNSIILLSLLWLVASCSSGSSSDGGGQTNGGDTPVPVTYSQSDEEGIWQYSAVQITSGDTMTGTMTFGSSGQLIGFNSSKCPGRPISYSEFWYLGDGWVKGRVYGFCSDPYVYVKFGMQFSNKNTMAGDMHVHYAFPNTEETYLPYNIKLTKTSPSNAARLRR